MQVVWVLTVLHLIAGGTVGAEVQASAPPPQQTELVTIGFYATKAACERMRAQLATAPGFKPGSARCAKELN